jgi:hypothetical protein
MAPLENQNVSAVPAVGVMRFKIGFGITQLATAAHLHRAGGAEPAQVFGLVLVGHLQNLSLPLLDMSLRMMLCAQPFNFERLGVILVMGLRLLSAPAILTLNFA